MNNSTAPDQAAADSIDAAASNASSATSANAVATIRPSDDHLVWVDMEMSGLDPESNRILEVAVVVTDGQLNIVAHGPVLVVHQTDEHMATMDAWNQGTHGRSGLTEKVKQSTLNEAQAEAELLAFLKTVVPASKSPMCGNTIHQDRRFMARYMPALEAYFHYRNLDVSTIKELCRRWRPEVYKGFEKKGAHTALADILESIEELRYYRDHFLSVNR
ncbi:oligoribonuclease [Betaproteobacteria bacterium LSUCC0115]|nr:oligoribonuclease [Burkholderiales bacterium LSUCC0115]